MRAYWIGCLAAEAFCFVSMQRQCNQAWSRIRIVLLVRDLGIPNFASLSRIEEVKWSNDHPGKCFTEVYWYLSISDLRIWPKSHPKRWEPNINGTTLLEKRCPTPQKLRCIVFLTALHWAPCHSRSDAKYHSKPESHSLLAISLRHQQPITPALPIFDRFTKDTGSLHQRESFSESVCKNQISLNSLEPTSEGRNDTSHVQDPQGSHGWPRQKGNPMDPLSPKSNLNPICFYPAFVSVNFDLSFHCLQTLSINGF